MIRNLTTLEVKIGERIYSLACDPMSPLEEVRGCLKGFAEMVDKIEADQKELLEKNQAVQTPQPENVNG